MLSLLRQQQSKPWRRHSSTLTRSFSTQQVPNSTSSGAHPSSTDYKKSLNFNFNFVRNNYNSNNNTSGSNSNDNRGFIQSIQSLSPASSSVTSTSTERNTNAINDRYIDFTHQSLLYRLERENFNGKLEKYIPPELKNHEHIKRQIDLEEIQELRGSTELDKMRQNLNLLGKGSTVRRVHEEMIDWFHPLKKSLEKEITDITNLVPAKDRSRYGPFLLLIPPEKLAIITLDTTVSLFLRTGNRPVTTNFLATYLGDLIEKEVNLTRLKQTKDESHQWINRLIKEKPQVALRLYNKMKTILQDKDQWSSDMKLKLGAFLLKVLSNDILNEHGDPVFRFYYVPLLKKTGTKFQGCFEMEKSSFERINKTSDGNFITNIRYLPMLLPPCKWDNRDYYGSYLLLKPPIMKHVSRAQVQAVQKAKMNEVNVGLDYLGSIPWRINTSLYDIINQCIEKNLLIGEIPSYQNLNIPTLEEYMASLPSELKASSSQDYLTNSYRYHRRRILQKNSELHSLRCDLSLKLSVAKEFLNDIIYFPHNLDFRGRAYPIPPNLNHIGSDLSRSLLLFHTKKPLGVNGLKWLKIHLCNLFGNNKISFDKREEYINKHIHDVYESAKTPFEGKMWWSTAEKPFQALATCMEIVKAIESGDPVNFESNFPVHQDGSCNGLQHYAGLGKDKDGGIAVNLVDGDIPSDVYTRVLDIVHKVMDEDSKIDANDADPLQRKKGEIARAIQRFVNRKTIKQTVMTSVYGVTFIGARSQGKTRIFSIHYCYSYFSCCLVQARLEEAWLKDKFGVEGTEGPKMISQQDEEFLYEAAGYLGRLTLKSLEQMFHSARGIMDWLAEVSKRISMEGQVMSWITPLGLPVMQPYREESHYMVKTALQSILVTRDDETLPVSKRKQRTAFPPNFVHSLDATHMMMTCLKMKNAHKTFAAVHDSYWTHPCDVEFMNKVLRECFVELYSKPILEDLKASLERRYPGVQLGEIPERGQLDLEEVKKSKFFFH